MSEILLLINILYFILPIISSLAMHYCTEDFHAYSHLYGSSYLNLGLPMVRASRHSNAAMLNPKNFHLQMPTVALLLGGA